MTISHELMKAEVRLAATQPAPVLTLPKDVLATVITRERANLDKAERVIGALAGTLHGEDQPMPAQEAIEVLGVVIDLVRQAADEVDPEPEDRRP